VVHHLKNHYTTEIIEPKFQLLSDLQLGYEDGDPCGFYGECASNYCRFELMEAGRVCDLPVSVLCVT